MATLLIGTDYDYSGGIFNIKDFEGKITQDNFMIFYTDLLHSVEQVSKGMRVVLQFKVFLADSPQEAAITYSPTNKGQVFLSSKRFHNFDDPSESSESDADSDTDSDTDMPYFKIYMNRRERREKERQVGGKSSKKYNKDQMNDFWQSIRMNNTYKDIELDKGRLDIITKHLLSHRFSNKSVAFLLYHFYPQKHLGFRNLRGFDRQLIHHLSIDAKKLNISLSLVNIKIKKQWLYDDREATENVDIYAPSEDCKKLAQPLKIFFGQRQALKEIIKLSSDAACFGNQGACASGQYWYSAAVCIVEFLNVF